MLQWMGGSRRNVTASGKSTQKRQKQYFEQRKWRRKQELTSIVDNDIDGLYNIAWNQRNNRSLDILSLLDVPKVTEECRPLCSTVANAASVDFCIQNSTQTVNTNRITPVDPVPTMGIRSSSTHHEVETVTGRFPLGSSTFSNNAYSIKDHMKQDCGIAYSHRNSIFDLIGDDIIIEDLERTQMQEAHAAFSVEGLGELGNETPIHSPRQLCRTLPGGQSSFSDSARHEKFFNNFDNELVDLEMEMDSFLRDDCLPFSCNDLHASCQNGQMLYPFSCRKLKFSGVEQQFGRKSNNKATSPLLYDQYVDEECGIARKHGDSNGGCRIGNNHVPDFISEGCDLPKRSPKKATATFDSLDSSAQCVNHEICLDYDIVIPDYLKCSSLSEDKRFSPGKWNSNLQSGLYPRPCFISEDSRDIFDSFSGESCSSSTAWDEAFTAAPSASNGRRIHCKDQITITNPSSETNYEHRSKQEEKYGISTKSSMKSNLSSSEEAYFPGSTITPKFEHKDHWLAEDGFPSVSINMHVQVNSFHLSSNYDHASLFCDAWEDNSIAGIVPGLHIDSDQSIGISKHDTPLRLSPASNPGLSFHSPQSLGSSLSSDAGLQKWRPELGQDVEVSVVLPDLSKVVGSPRPKELETFEMSGEENVRSPEGNKFEIEPPQHPCWTGSCSILPEHEILEASRHVSDEKGKEAISSAGVVLQKKGD